MKDQNQQDQIKETLELLITLKEYMDKNEIYYADLKPKLNRYIKSCAKKLVKGEVK